MTQLVSREAHRFEAAGRSYLYLVPSAAVFGLDETSRAVIDALDDRPWQADDLVDALGPELGRTEVKSHHEPVILGLTLGQSTST